MNQDSKHTYICSIASGSNGNAYYIGTDDEAILIDCGISYRQLIGRAKKAKINLHNVKAVFVTHEHSDHVRGLRVFCQNYNVPCYMTRGTALKCRSFYMPIKPPIAISYNEKIVIGSFSVYCFEKPHDVEEPCSFRVEVNSLNIGVFTDIGCECQGLCEHLHECHVAFLESNYDEDMLWAGKYPMHLKQRVASDYGHLSNKQAADIVRKVDPPYLHTIILSHLSADNNHPLIAHKAFVDFTDKMNIMHASRYEVGNVFEVFADKCTRKA